MINYENTFWKKTSFILVMRGTIAFVILTVIAMFVYPGGSMTDPSTRGYSFFENFFSELGFFVTKSGASNYFAALLFFFALTLAGSGMILFFLAFPQFFQSSQSQKTLSTIGTALGVISGICFVGVAFTPADLLLDAHVQFVLWAFRLFPAAVFFYAIAIFQNQDYPNQFGWEMVIFFVLLIGYILLLELGPSADDSHQGQVIQATGQKVIVYASIASVTFQAWGALQARKDSPSSS